MLHVVQAQYSGAKQMVDIRIVSCKNVINVDILHIVCWRNNLSVDILSVIVLRHDVSGGSPMGVSRTNLFLSASSFLSVQAL